MQSLVGRLRAVSNNRWLVFVVSMWIQSCAGIGYLFGSISPVVKSTMGYDQKQVSYLGVSKNLGDCIGFISGQLCNILPFWVVLFLGALQNFVGYGLLWALVTGKLPVLPFWTMCIAIFVGTNGETYYNTATLVACVQNFPENRGPIVGILKGFAGLSGAILAQVYHMFNFSNPSSLILMIAVAPPTTVICLMFFVRSVNNGYLQQRPSDGLSFAFVYSVCILLAAYIMGLLIIDDLNTMTRPLVILSSTFLLLLLLVLVIIPIILELNPKSQVPLEESLLPKVTEEREELRAVDEEMTVTGENLSLLEALVKVDFWLIFVSLVLGTGSGITIIDNMGQICQSLGFSDTRVFVAMISVSNFLGRVGGGYFSEHVVRKYVYPRPVALAVVQLIMVFGLIYYAMEWPAAIYVLTLLNALGYGAHWSIALATISELFGLKSFGVLYNCTILSMPLGSFIFSSGLASRIYDYYAQAQVGPAKAAFASTFQLNDGALTCAGPICYTITCAILSGVVFIASVLSLIIVIRNREFYANLYAKVRS
ncbi:hypothetical protein vseg_017891 [Gypsophila vaccaria]